ncbi:unnamed protein product [Fraxinus pennsylvanica]|uniref:Uncharacterized protein n=1 Tax=Fraxinus pennsylvanica TaxID=56036 RepID=A0AAD1Z8J4_9LAMI|nr:unnamed protein product [Fraxinus pennsylvanica]
MEAAANKACGNFAKELEDELLKYTVNHEDIQKMDAPLVDQTEAVHKIADVEVDVTECTKSGGNGISEVERQDSTENSSSFDDSDSGIESGNTEVVSHFHDEGTSALDFDGFGEIFRMRKKKLTTHWRSFIQPLVWRCKWAELQIKKFQSQAKEYDRKLAEYTQQKQCQSQNLTLEDGVKSLPFSCNNVRSKVLKRKKRRTEETTDVAAYMSRHNLFSYYENKKSFAEVAVMDDEWRNPAIATEKINFDDDFWANDELQWLESGDGDNSWEHVLRKIGYLQSQVSKMKSRVDKVMSENAGKNSSTVDLSFLMPSNALVGSPRNTASLSNNGDRMPVGSYIAPQLLSEYNMGNIVKRETSGLSLGDVPDVIESTDQSVLGDSCKTAEDDVLINNTRLKEDMNNFEEVKIQAIQKPLVLNDGSGSTIPPLPADADQATDDQPPPKLRSISKITAPKIRRKRGRRKGSGQWKRRSSA